MLYSPTDAAPQFLKKHTPLLDFFGRGFTIDNKHRWADGRVE